MFTSSHASHGGEGGVGRAPEQIRVRAWRAFALAMLLAACVLSVSTADASAGAVKAMWGPAFRDGVSQFPVYRELGVKIYEDDLRWSPIARRRPRNPLDPGDPAYVWPAEVDSSVGEAGRYGMRVALEIIGSPRWANGGKPPQWAPRSPRDFADFAAAAAKHYRSVHLWMIWGEPSRLHNFRPLTPARPYRPLSARQQIAPHLYARLLDAAFGALKAVSSANLVIGGMTDAAASISPAQWIENMRLPDGRPPRLDLYGHNPFSIRAPNLANPPSSGGQIDFSDLGRLAELVEPQSRPPQEPRSAAVPLGVDDPDRGGQRVQLPRRSRRAGRVDQRRPGDRRADAADLRARLDSPVRRTPPQRGRSDRSRRHQEARVLRLATRLTSSARRVRQRSRSAPALPSVSCISEPPPSITQACPVICPASAPARNATAAAISAGCTSLPVGTDSSAR